MLQKHFEWSLKYKKNGIVIGCDSGPKYLVNMLESAWWVMLNFL